jgi:serine/threonine protein kinase
MMTPATKEILLKEQEEKALEEVQQLINLQHPHVVQFRGVKIEKDEFWIVTSYMVNGTLRDYITTRQNLTDTEKLVLALDVAKGTVHCCFIHSNVFCIGMAYIHGQNFVHKDLTSLNVLINENGRACVSDLGISTRGISSSPAGHGGNGTYS